MPTKECLLENKTCNNCGECLICDLDRSKNCNNCMECIDTNIDFNAIGIDDVVYDEE
ncbi:hypothetical protein [Orenia marismortui]|uniref:Uncharacterized protein n=1 Tax=Orenia marismortui TaxID=46469 RepID=A0A4R8H589_9FIRM|nr:hypothetical protein [Orenia marismortui]TDX52319.1 hypothetical protein C7959_10726 [Orenia marismortui]